ncbi:Bug family tripartite tricarboxylate transporter substrate binding protein [Achromobacter anxifer]|uniref:Bug family tripartite tricarboxylate transporter substrate binding protein n=1 Tax=Achromobacter anxifer TaxID=1287737 RepID=UPI0021581664|nr:tripartite tricarboxylate transporter substrate binding protein [Achromobacter anxifer]
MLKLICGALAAWSLAVPLAAAAAYPDHPVTLVVPSVPGGAADVVGRLVATELAKRWNVPVIVENRAGGASIIGTQAVARAKPDGYTLLLGPDASFTAVPYLLPDVQYQAKDFAPIATLATLQYVLVGAPGAPFKSLRELLDQARARPDAITYASGGPGSTHHLAMALFERAAGISLKHVPYKAAPQGFVGVMGDQVDLMFIVASTAVPQIKAGKVQGLANAGAAPIAGVPELPMVKDTVKDFTFYSWFGLFAPARTPAPVLAELQNSVAAVLQSPEVRDKMQAQGMIVGDQDGLGLSERIARDVQVLAPVIADIKTATSKQQ